MKRNPLVWLSAVLAFGSLTTYLLAQQLAPTGAGGTLDDAIALLNEGEPQQAKNTIATIDKSDPTYASAQSYDALCRYELKDYLGFLKQMDSPEVKEAAIAAEVRENLAFKQVDALFRFRKFEDTLAKIDAFQNAYPSSPQLAALAEYRMASLFERGMKTAHDSSLLKDETQFQARWAEGKTNLEQFLALAAVFAGTNYTSTTLQKRALREDVWAARLTLGDEKAALESIPVSDTAGLEEFSLLRVQLYQQLQPDKVDRNLQLMADFLQQFPNSTSRNRVQFDMAGLDFRLGEKLCQEADAAERAGDASGARDKRAQAGSYFEAQRSLQSQVTLDKAAGIEASDFRDLQEDLLYSYLLQKNYATLASLTSGLLAHATPGDLDWMMGKLYDGIALMSQETPNPAGAAALFDEVLALNFKNRPDHDRWITIAARWRLSIALKAGDTQKATQLIQWVRDSNCTKNLKRAFIADYGNLAGVSATNSK